jgi:hypothetical protein
MRGTTGLRGRRALAAAVLLAAALTLGACARTQTAGTSSGGATTSIAPAPGAPVASDSGSTGSGTSLSSGATPEKSAGAPSSTTVQTLIVVNKTLRIETKDVDASIARIRELAARDGGDIASMQVSTATDQPVYPVPLSGSASVVDQSVPLQAYVVVRVPFAKYAAFVADAVKLGRVLFQSESAEDVTQQHVDMKARLGNLTAEQSRLRQLFSRATKVSDMLAIEQELTRVQGDIESMQAQIVYLEKQASFATVTIEMAEPTPIVSPTGTDWGVGTALTDSIRAFVETMNGLIVLLGPALAVLVFIGLPVLLVVWLVRRAVRRRRATVGPKPEPVSPESPIGLGK